MAEIDVTTDRRCPGHHQVHERWQMISPTIVDVFNGNRLVSSCQLFLMRSKDRIATRVGIGLSRLAFSICANSSAELNRDATSPDSPLRCRNSLQRCACRYGAKVPSVAQFLRIIARWGVKTRNQFGWGRPIREGRVLRARLARYEKLGSGRNAPELDSYPAHRSGGRHKRQLFGEAIAPRTPCQQSPLAECATIFICAKNAGSEDFRYLLPIAGLADCRYLPPQAGSADCRLLPLTILSVPACYIERSTRDRNKAVWTVHRADNPTLSAWNSARTLLLREVPCHSLIRSSSSFPFRRIVTWLPRFCSDASGQRSTIAKQMCCRTFC
jgi:hypothetical protein